jgi:hypothetical protein
MADTNRASVVTDDQEEFDRLTLIRLGVWGLSAFLSMMLVVIAAQTDIGVKRAAAAVAAITSPPRDPTVTIAQVMARTAESEREARRLVENVRLLTLERDRLTTRLDSVEKEMGDLTGSINKTLANTAQQQPQSVPPPAPARNAPQAPPTVGPTASVPAMTPTVTPSVVPPPPVPPQPPAPASTSSNTSASQPTIVASSMIPAVPSAAVDPKTARVAWPTFMPPPTAPSIEPTAPAPPEVAAAPEAIPLPRPSPLAALQAYAAATARGENATLPPGQIPQPGQTQPLPADVTNSTSASPARPQITAQITAPQTAPQSAPQVAPAETVDSGDQPKVEIGVDLGPGLSIARLRTRWEAFQKAQGANLVGVRPVVAIREVNPNKPVELRLVVGPLAGIDVAVQLCQSLSGSQFPCQPAVFDGQRLVTR